MPRGGRRKGAPGRSYTERPNEPLTAGIAEGPGPGPEVLGLGGGDPAVDELRAIYLRYPTESLRELLEEMEG